MKKNKMMIIPILFITIIGIIINLIIIGSIWNNRNFKFTTEESIASGEHSSIKVRRIVSNNNKLNKEINKAIDNIERDFNKDLGNKNGNLVIDYEYTTYKKIYSFHINSTSNIKDIIKRRDSIIYFDSKNKKVLKQEELIKKDYGLYTVLNSKCIDYLEEKGYKDFDDSLLEIDDKNYQLLIFSKNDMQVLLINNNEELSVPIEYEYIKDYLNNSYFDIKVEKKKVKKKEKKEIEITEDKEETVQENVDKTDELPKYLAFTFDDGPAMELTTTLLDGLKERNAKVTFFVLGNRAQNQEETIKRMIEEGHVVGSHTYSHKNLLKLSLNAALEEINTSNEIIKSITGDYPKYLRPPYGNYNKALLENCNMTFILWNVDTEDWKKRDTELVYQHIITNARDGDIVLLHDLYPTSVEGVLKAMDYLKEQNYRFVTIEEMAKIKGINLETNKTYRYIK